MPRHPSLSPSSSGVYTSVFARVADRLRAHRGEVYPLHIGDTYLDPLPAARLVTDGASAELARYAHPDGRLDLRRLVARRLQELGLPHREDEVTVVAGATHGLFCAAAALLEPGEEVLLLAPYWPLIPGILRTAGAVPVEVPCFDRLAEDPSLDVASLLDAHLTRRTAAVYFNSPNNPTGRVLDRRQVQSLADFARARSLWVLADEVYAGFDFAEPAPLVASLPGMAERTVSVFSFSKSYAMAGYRVGYLSAPRAVVEAARKVSTHTVYSVSAIGQRLAGWVLEQGAALREAVRESYRLGAERTSALLRARFHAPQGGAYVFLDLRGLADPAAVLARALDRGVALAPGEAFGPSYAHWARLCYTAVPPDRLERGLAVLNEVLAEAR